jgi:transcriptional regulator GlxA family with amidase domain
VKESPGTTRIGILAYPGAQAAAVHGLVDLLGAASRIHAAREAGGPALETLVLRADGAEDVPPVPAPPLAALVLPPSLEDVAGLARLGPLAAWLAARHRQGTVLCSVCAGAFLLARTGLLSGRPATTHWALAKTFAERFPDVRLDAQKILVDDGDVLTAGGVMAWVDLALLLVSRTLGPTTTLAVSRAFVVDPGGREQRFYETFAPVLTHGDDAVLKVQHEMQAGLARPLSLAAMARKAGTSERTFLRRFRRATGRSPTEYLHLLRVERARGLLESSALGFEEIARRLGYEDPGAFRRVFVRVLGLTPGEYRRRFRPEPSSPWEKRPRGAPLRPEGAPATRRRE